MTRMLVRWRHGCNRREGTSSTRHGTGIMHHCNQVLLRRNGYRTSGSTRTCRHCGSSALFWRDSRDSRSKRRRNCTGGRGNRHQGHVRARRIGMCCWHQDRLMRILVLTIGMVLYHGWGRCYGSRPDRHGRQWSWWCHPSHYSTVCGRSFLIQINRPRLLGRSLTLR